MLPIARPPWTKLGKKLESAMRKAIFSFKMIEDDPKIALALSGGKDSLSLLYLLCAISGRGVPKLDITAIHVNGEFSCGAGVDESYLRAICQELEVDFVSFESKQQADNLECYSCSRERRKLIFTAARERGIELVAFGHHRDDNAQTLLMNLFFKGEFAGNLPKLKMIDYDVTIIRPLIYISENDLKSFAREHGFARLSCQCPKGLGSMRKIVDRMLEEAEGPFPNIRANVSNAVLQYGSEKARRKK